MKIQPDNQTLLLAGAPAPRQRSPGSVFAVLNSNRLNVSVEPSIDEAELLFTADAVAATYAKPISTEYAAATSAAATPDDADAAEAPATPTTVAATVTLRKNAANAASRAALGLYASTQTLAAYSSAAVRVDTYA